MAITDRDIRAARERGRKLREETSWAVAARYDRRTSRIVIAMANGLEFSFAADQAQGLEDGSAAELSEIEILPSGLGLHWPKLDADLYVPALLKGVFGSRKWMAQRMGAAGGRARTKAKSTAARENGKRGGRPKKKEPA